jgi:hypothetical protein
MANGDDLTETTDPAWIMMRQVAGAFAQYEKARLVQKLRVARDRKSQEAGARGEARSRPEVLEVLRELREAHPKASQEKLGALRSAGSRRRLAARSSRTRCGDCCSRSAPSSQQPGRRSKQAGWIAPPGFLCTYVVSESSHFDLHVVGRRAFSRTGCSSAGGGCERAA